LTPVGAALMIARRHAIRPCCATHYAPPDAHHVRNVEDRGQ
jgi:hypothetical protein